MTKLYGPAIVLCNPIIRAYLINYARPLIYSTTMPYLNVLAIKAAFEMLEEGHGDVVRFRPLLLL